MWTVEEALQRASFLAQCPTLRVSSTSEFLHQSLSIHLSHTVCSPFKVFAIATDLGTISQTSESVTWAVGVLRNPVIAYRTPSGAVQNRSPYFMTKYPDFQSAVGISLRLLCTIADQTVVG